MAVLGNISALALKPAAAPTTNNLTAGPDQFVAAFGSRYLLRFNNPTGASFTIKLNDPVSVAPSDGTAFDPDVTLEVPAGAVREAKVEAMRFRDNDGNIIWTYSVGTGVGSTVEIKGPL